MLDFLICQFQAALVVTVVCMDASCILVHDLLHGFFQLLCRQIAGLTREICFVSRPGRRLFTSAATRCLVFISSEVSSQSFGGNLTFSECPRHVFLRGAACDIAGSKQPVNGRFPLRIDPKAAGCMAADHIRFRALDLDRLLFRPLAALDPLERLRRCHVEVGVIEITLLLCCDVARIEVAGPIALAVLLHSPEDALGRREPVLRLVDLPLGVDLLGADPLRNRAGRCNRVLAAQCDEAVLERRHLRARPDAHRIARPRVERRVPHLVAREARIVGPVEPCGTARRNQHGLCLDVISRPLAHREAPGTVHGAIRDLEVRDVDVVEHGDV